MKKLLKLAVLIFASSVITQSQAAGPVYNPNRRVYGCQAGLYPANSLCLTQTQYINMFGLAQFIANFGQPQ